MNSRNKAKLKAADLIEEMVQSRRDEADKEGFSEAQDAYERVLEDIKIYKMIIRKSDKYGPMLCQQEPGCDY